MNNRLRQCQKAPRDARLRSLSRPMMNEVSIRLMGSAGPALREGAHDVGLVHEPVAHSIV